MEMPAAGSPILSVDRDNAAANRTIDEHTHPEAMLVWSETATIIVSTVTRDWLVPPGFGLWVPAEFVHSERALRAGSVHVVRFARHSAADRWQQPTGVVVGPLLRELVNHLQTAPPEDSSRVYAEPLLFELLQPLPAHSVEIAIPADPRLRQIAERIIADPADDRNLEYWAREVHAGARTVSRLFITETGLTFGRWRTHIRMRAAIQHLADGLPVNQIAREIGYRKTSAFIAAFRRETGRTPRSYGAPTDPLER